MTKCAPEPLLGNFISRGHKSDSVCTSAELCGSFKVQLYIRSHDLKDLRAVSLQRFVQTSCTTMTDVFLAIHFLLVLATKNKYVGAWHVDSYKPVLSCPLFVAVLVRFAMAYFVANKAHLICKTPISENRQTVSLFLWALCDVVGRKGSQYTRFSTKSRTPWERPLGKRAHTPECLYLDNPRICRSPLKCKESILSSCIWFNLCWAERSL